MCSRSHRSHSPHFWNRVNIARLVIVIDKTTAYGGET
jgi:hypothetical protein